MRTFIVLLLLLHGLVTLLGFLKSIKPEWIRQLKEQIPTFHGLLWLVAALLFLFAAVALVAEKLQWWMFALPAVLISQAMVIRFWQDAKFGTLANVILLAAIFLAFSAWRFKKAYRIDVTTSFKNEQTDTGALSGADLEFLPEVVRKYLKYTGHTQKITHFFSTFEGSIRSGADAPWMAFKATQHSWIRNPARYFFMNATMKGIPVAGYHRFRDQHASMDIRALSLFPVSSLAGNEMNTAETVTHLNDMCLLAPASLIDKRIEWLRADDHEAELAFNNNGIRVKAILQFNNKGELVNFISDDRYMVGKDQQLVRVRWSTPVHGYKEEGGIRYPSSGEAIWGTGDKAYAYAKMNILTIRINPTKPR